MLVEIGNTFDATRPGLIKKEHLQDLASVLAKVRSMIRGKHPHSKKAIEVIDILIEDAEDLSKISLAKRNKENIKAINKLGSRLLGLAEVLRTASVGLTFKILLDQVS